MTGWWVGYSAFVGHFFLFILQPSNGGGWQSVDFTFAWTENAGNGDPLIWSQCMLIS
jgi:hypothetical protein